MHVGKPCCIVLRNGPVSQSYDIAFRVPGTAYMAYGRPTSFNLHACLH